ncbi:MAG: hypothetical protein QOF62_3891 [Pyrinomonadaceae bacterium]|jgi:hypothetical protein|nr:hypothetical protein [Pyrinomonadaceae bacterium]
MFNTTILDVAIGLIFVYLLLSLMCTAANEIIELLLKKRAIDLERGIRELLVPGSNSGADDVVRSLYNHPLVNSLFGGQYENSRIDNTIKRKLFRTGLPSYIPARNFSLALMDLILPGVAPGGAAGGPSGATGATAPSPAPGTPSQVVVNLAGGTPPLVVPPPPAVPNLSLIALRSALLANPLITAQIRQGLIPLLDAAGNDVARVRENIEGWYNASMDRVSSWYKRRAQVTILILGLFVAVTVNVDTITIAKRLSTDRALRDSLVAASDAYAKAHASPTPTSSPAAPTKPAAPAVKTDAVAPNPVPAGATISPSPVVAVSPAVAVASPSAPAVVSPSASPPRGAANTSPLPEDCVKDANSVKCKLAQDVAKACGAPNSVECKNARALQKVCGEPDSPECKGEKDLQAACQEPESPKCKYLANLQQIQALGLPIGWDSTEDPKRTWPGRNFFQPGGWSDQIYWHALGWILTALALSLGAPFWFDLLNKFIVIRSAVKPHEKSPEEGSKD